MKLTVQEQKRLRNRFDHLKLPGLVQALDRIAERGGWIDEESLGERLVAEIAQRKRDNL